MSAWCGTCGEFAYANHACPPAWLIWRPEHSETEDDARTVYGMSARYAVEKWAGDRDRNGDYDIVRGNEAIVMVRPSDLSAEAVRYSVMGESVPEYTAREAK